MSTNVTKENLQEFATKLHAKNKTIFATKTDVGSPLVAATAAAMTDTDKIYVYTGSETGYTAGDWYYYNGSAWASGGVYNAEAIETDTTLKVSGMAADAKAVGDEFAKDLWGVPLAVREAIYTLLNSAAYATTGLEDEIAVVETWAEEVYSLTLSADNLSLTGSTPQALIPTVVPPSASVTWSSSDSSIATVVGGVVTGVSNGSCVITATAGGLSANCAVTVSGFATLESISAVYTQSGTVYDTDSLDSLKAGLVVTATYDDTSTATVPSDSYSLSGTLTVGTSTITVTYQGKTTTFSVPVNGLYKLASAFTSTGSNSIDTNTNIPASGTITVAEEFIVTSFTSAVSFVFGNHKAGSNDYCAIQTQVSNSANYVWGLAMGWSAGKNSVSVNNVVRMVHIITASNGGMTISISTYFKNVTKNTSNTYSNTNTATSVPYSQYPIILGNPHDNTGFKGTLNKFKIESGEWTQTQIDNFLAGN